MIKLTGIETGKTYLIDENLISVIESNPDSKGCTIYINSNHVGPKVFKVSETLESVNYKIVNNISSFTKAECDYVYELLESDNSCLEDMKVFEDSLYNENLKSQHSLCRSALSKLVK